MTELYQNVDAYTPDNLFVGQDIPVLTKAVTLQGAQGVVARGTVLGEIAKAIGSITADGGNTGNGDISDAELKEKAEKGIYTIECISKGSTPAASGTASADPGNTGDGTITSEPSTDSNCKIGTYRITCIAEAADGGEFQVEDPDGFNIGTATVGTEFSNHITFTISDGSTDFVVGDRFTVEVEAAADSGIFSVKTPSGYVLPENVVVGTPYESEHIGFTVNDGDTDFIVGDKFTIAVEAGSGKYKIVDSSNVDGTQEADCILADDVDTADGDITVAAYRTGHFNRQALTFGGADTAADHEERLRELGIYLSDNISY